MVRQAHQPLRAPQAHQPLSAGKLTNKLPKLKCPNLPGFKNLAGLISGFIESSFLNRKYYKKVTNN
jgi:hypothetical protein